LIYSSVIQALLAEKIWRNGKKQSSFYLTTENIEWLGRTFLKGDLGTSEEAKLCMMPAYSKEMDKKS